MSYSECAACIECGVIYKMYFLHPSAAQMPAKYHSNKVKPRGVSNRNRGLDWIRANATKGVIYFADDDNSYDVTLLEQVSGIIGPLA